MKMMQAVLLDRVTPAAQIRLTNVPAPQVRPGWVLIRVKAFGLNHSEQILRQGEIKADYIQKPVIPGIECVGKIEDPSDSGFAVGQRVVALMGGMGRSFNGSYAEYALLPTHHVFATSCSLPWAQLGAVPETYFTAYGSLLACLRLQAEDTLLIRGATCALGYAAIQLAKAVGCRVIATTHREAKLPLLTQADEALVDGGVLTGKVHGATKALDLVGARNLRDTLTAVEPGAIVCHTGVLGGVFSLQSFNPLRDIPSGVYLTGFHSNCPTQQAMDAIFTMIRDHSLTPTIGKVFPFAQIKDAIAAQDAGSVNGKIVVTV